MTTIAKITSPSTAPTFGEFMALQPEAALEVWKSLPPPPFGELDGEYKGQFLPTHSDLHKRWTAENLYNETSPRGYWLGKAFKPLGQASGEGYNVWRLHDESVKRNTRYATHLGVSRVDGRLAVIMTYASFNRSLDAAGFGMAWQGDNTDEIRKLADGVYVGLGTRRLDQPWPADRSLMLEVFKSYGLEVKDHHEMWERTPATPAIFVLTGPVETAIGVDDSAAEDR